LGISQITAWGSIYYLFALLMEPLQASVNASKGIVVGAFSLALLISGLLSPVVGWLIDRHGGRYVMASGSLLAGLSLCLLSYVESAAALYAVWALLGIAMSATLYDPAFAVLTHAFRHSYRRAITALTLFGGFASTVFWPLTTALIVNYGWRDAVAILGVLNLVICIPLHLFMLPRAPHSDRSQSRIVGRAPASSLQKALRERRFYLLCLAFAANALTFSAMSVHMIAMLVGNGVGVTQAAWIGAMIGPMQVAGRILELTFGRHVTPSKIGAIALAMLPLSLVVFFVAGNNLVTYAAFAILYGASNGVMTIVRGAIPAELYGVEQFGAVNGAMAAPVLISKAAGPLAAALLFTAVGGYPGVVLVLAAVALFAVVVFCAAAQRSVQQQKTLPTSGIAIVARKNDGPAE
jgi:MFS family permease